MPNDQAAAHPQGIDQDRTQEIPRWQESVSAGMYDKRINSARRAIQTGVHWRNGFARETEAALSVRLSTLEAHLSALTGLLQEKGLFSRLEYLRALACTMEVEAARLQCEISDLQGRQVDLYDPR